VATPLASRGRCGERSARGSTGGARAILNKVGQAIEPGGDRGATRALAAAITATAPREWGKRAAPCHTGARPAAAPAGMAIGRGRRSGRGRIIAGPVEGPPRPPRRPLASGDRRDEGTPPQVRGVPRAPVRSSNQGCRGRRGDRVGPSTSGFAGRVAPNAAEAGARLDPLPAPFLSGLLPPLATRERHHAGCPGVKVGEAAERSEGNLDARASRRWYTDRARGVRTVADRGSRVAPTPEQAHQAGLEPGRRFRKPACSKWRSLVKAWEIP
jgi:hypothetical protein